MPDWGAELVVDEELARRLLGQFPELEIESLRPFAQGWDYTIWLVNEEWAFRFPRREVAVSGVRREIAVLPQLAPLLPLPVPAPSSSVSPPMAFPGRSSAARSCRGASWARQRSLSRPGSRSGARWRDSCAPLHEAEVAHDLPADANRRADMSARVPKTREQLRELETAGIWQRPAAVERLLESAEELPASEAAAIVHGDLHFRQVLVADAETPTGVIDWVDVCRSG